MLKAEEEREIGLRIEVARGELLAAAAMLPCARHTILKLADDVRRGVAPAAELILLPDGGELKPANIEPVLKAFTRIEKAPDEKVGAILRELPIRPRWLTKSSPSCERSTPSSRRSGKCLAAVHAPRRGARSKRACGSPRPCSIAASPRSGEG